MLVNLPASLHYPITITGILKQAGDNVKRLETVLTYTYKTEVKEDTGEFGEEVSVLKEFPAQFESPLEGKIKRWYTIKGAVIPSSDIELFEIEEPCPHSVQYGGLCCECGIDVTEKDYTSFSYQDRATITMSHDNSGLTVTKDEAARLETEAKTRLLNSKKLSLVVDLDQTIIHATVDPTVGEWKADPTNPNHEYVKDVRAFQLNDEVAGGRGCWYYVKMRPGLKEFLEKISELYECHIYTMGTRAYALNVAKIVDPDGKIFSNRLLSRDESGSLTQKDLKRLFPVDQKMVVIIDDREDVWGLSKNLVKVRPYSFFVGIGDINAAFLPKKAPEVKLPTVVKKKAAEATTVSDEDAEIDIELPDVDTESDEDEDEVKVGGSTLSTLEQLVSAGDDKILLDEQTDKLSEVIRAQQESRPLAKQQQLLDEQDGIVGSVDTTTVGNSTGGSEAPQKHQRHHLLHDDDRELYSLKKNLINVHHSFFSQYDRKLQSFAQKNLLKDPRSHRRRVKDETVEQVQLKAVPDIAHIMPSLKKKTFDGLNFVFSGIVPTGTPPMKTETVRWSSCHGAIVTDEQLCEKTTHLIAARPRTQKVREAAAAYPHVKIVSPQWVYDSISHWERLPEDDYLIEIHPEDRAMAFTPGTSYTATTSGSFTTTATNEDDRLSENATDSGNASDDEAEIDEEDLREFEKLEENKKQAELNNIDWASANAELEEFLAEDGDTDDSDGGASDTSMDSNDSRSSKKRSVLVRDGESKKRKSGEEERTDTAESKEESESETGDRPVGNWRLKKRQKLASSNLRVVETVAEVGGDGANDSKEEEEVEEENTAKVTELKTTEAKSSPPSGDDAGFESDFDLEQELLDGLGGDDEDD